MNKKKNTKKNNTLGTHIYIRMDVETKERIKALAVQDGSNLTIWVRQLIKRELANG